MRKEIKIPIHKYNYLIFKSWIDLNVKCQYEHEDRIVNSIYYDTNDFKSAQDNLAGISDRKKYRIRWYNYEEVVTPKLEVKIKNGSVGTKKIFPLPKLDLNRIITRDSLSILFSESQFEDQTWSKKSTRFLVRKPETSSQPSEITYGKILGRN